MYKVIVRPILCILWLPKTEIESVTVLLTRVQRLACICITGAMNSTPTAALEILLSLPRINFFIKQEADLSVARLFRNKHWVAGESKVNHAKLLNDLKRRLPEVEMYGLPY